MYNQKHSMDSKPQLRNKTHARVLELFNNGHLNNDIDNINVRKDVENKLLPYQTLHTFNMITAIKNNKIVIDGSSTGTGKTYTSIAVCAQLGLIPLIICPKNIMSAWKNVINYFGISHEIIINYEALRSGKNINLPYMTITDDTITWNFKNHPRGNKIIFIFDEVHRCKNHKSLNGRLLLSCFNQRVIMLSATLCDKNADFGIFGMMLGFYKKHTQGKQWINSIMRESKNQYGKKKTNILHSYLFPEKGSKMSLDDLGDMFPMNQISTDCYNLEPEQLKQVNAYYDEMKNAKDNKLNQLSQLNNMRQKIENVKTSIIIELLTDYYEQNMSIVVFINYVSSYNIIASHLRDKKIKYAEINGRQNIEQRDVNINKFQNNEVRVMISMIQAGGASISLHDTTGSFPRVSIISPSYSRIELIQALGRIYRSGVRSPCLQKIIFCAGTCEERIASILHAKKNMTDTLTDDDVMRL